MANRHPSGEPLARLRAQMRAHHMAALVLPSADPHLSEYLPSRWQGRAWASGFTGSVGSLLLTAEEAALCTDSRYWLQAEAELAGSGIALLRANDAASVDAMPLEWLRQRLPRGARVAIDGQVLSVAAAALTRDVLAKAGVSVMTDVDLLNAAWPERPGLPTAAVYEHLPPQADGSRADKLQALRAAMVTQGADHHWLAAMEDIAWVLNLRGSDVPFNPVFLAHLLVEPAGCTLFTALAKISAPLRERLAMDGVQLAEYWQAGAALAALPADAALLFDPQRVPEGLLARAPATVLRVAATNPSTLIKSRKTAAEAACLRETMAQDGAALCEFYAWLEQTLQTAPGSVTELDLHEALTRFRTKRPGFIGPSFNTIAGYQANGAMPHYSASAATAKVIEGEGLLLIDSGGQYLGGTTDITRVWPIGSPTPAQQRDYTLVLKGLIALSSAHFPRGTLAPMLDALARAPLWREGLDYAHGTGHGVGYFLNVHEGPQKIAPVLPHAEMAMQPGMVTSIEPGVYRPGAWGIRLENLVLNVEVPGTDFLAFETLSLCPFDTHCLAMDLLRPDEIAWVDAYHSVVRQRLSPWLQGPALAWLMARTQPLQTNA